MSEMGQNAKNGGYHAMSAWLLIPEMQVAPDSERKFGSMFMTMPNFVVPPWYQCAGVHHHQLRMSWE